MSGDKIGRSVTIKVGGAAVATGRTKSLTINNTLVDVTADDDDGIQKLLSVPGQKNVEVTLDGMYLSSDTTLLDLALNSDISATVDLEYGAGLYALSGTYAMGNYSEGMPYNEAITFSASFSSSGEVTKTLTP
jgi:predicted secreted protein